MLSLPPSHTLSGSATVPYLPRLLKILNVAAKYRLDEFLTRRSAIPLRLLIRLHGVPWSFHRVRREHKYRRLRLALEDLGPIYIKLGQLLSTRRDFLDMALADELQSLQDRVPPFNTPGITEIVELALGLPADRVFSELNQEPLASASVAQVHSARLISGEEVVVKVIRPGIDKTVNADIKLLQLMAAFVEKATTIGKRLHAIEVIRDYERIIQDELNLVAEGANTTQLRRNFENSDKLYIPKVFWEYSRSNVLVMERIYGIPVSDIASLKAHGIDLKKLAETGVEIFFTQVFTHSYFHADMHPGNIFVAPDKVAQPQYIAIDCAIIGSLSKDDQQYLARNLLAIFKRDYRKVARLHVECGWVPKETKIHEFEAAMRTVCEPIFEKPLKDISFGQLLVQLFRTAGRFNMEVQPSLVLLQKTLLNVEGLGRQLYPDLDLWKTALPFLESWNARRMNPFTLMARVQENVPDWIEQLPMLPQILINAATDTRQLALINQNLENLQNKQVETHARRRRYNRYAGLAALAAGLLSLHPAVNEWLQTLPLTGTVLFVVGVYFLYFRR
ncbi:MAG: ubiquinone biosynthesis regulatory protein kinase UbiB [Pseudohongiellaceae bacterium]